MRQLILSVDGHCPECGDDLSDDISLWATESWLARYETDQRLRRGIDHSVVRLVLDQHKQVCAGRSAPHQSLAQTA